MRRTAAVGIWILLALLFAAPVFTAQSAAAPPGPSATPAPPEEGAPAPAPSANPLDIYIDEGPVAFFLAVVREWGPWGIVALLFAVLVYFLVLTPLGKLAQDRVQEWYETLLSSLRKPVPTAELRRRQADYLLRLDLTSPEEQAERKNAYLRKMDEHLPLPNPFDDKKYVPLEVGLMEFKQRIGLSLGGIQEDQLSFWQRFKARVPGKRQPGPVEKMFQEKDTFDDIAEAVNAVDKPTNAPYPVLALLGEPGAGKSTLLRKLFIDCVQRRLADPAAPFPFLVSLGAHKTGSPLSFLHREWKSMLGCDGLEEDLAAGRVWLFADGLNEMPRKRYQEGMDDWRSFLSRYITPHGNRAFVACRVADYGEGIGAPRLIVHKMDPTRIWNFLQKGFPDRAADLWRDLVIDRDQRSGKIYELAQIPFWLMTLARLSKRTGLPGNRASLLEASVDQWLEYERTRDGGHPLSDDQCRAFIEDLINLAWAGLSRSQNYTFPLPEAKRILRAGNSAVDAGELLRLAQDCDFLAVEGENVRFHHQILQEYFAARELARRFAKGKNLRRHWRIPWEDWKFVYSRWDELPDPPQTNWEEALVLAAGMLDEQKAEALALAVLRDNSPLAARCAIESGAGVREQVQQKIKAGLQNDLQGRRQRLPARLAAGKMLARMGDPRLLRRQHAFQREDGKTVHFIEPEWVDIPAGSFTMGSTALERLLLWALHGVQPAPDERPAHTVSTGAYKVARYPVTVVEYFLFMDAGGYDNDAYWQAPGALRWRDAPPPFEESWMAYSIQALRADEKGTLEDLNVQVKQGRYSPAQAEAVCQALGMKEEALKALWWRSEAEKRNAQGRAVRPWRWDISDGSLHNRPVVGVTWFEACAYAAWLEESLRAQQLLPGQWRLRLPTEAEWEKAARGGRQGLWAWGSRWSRDRANTLEGRVMEPTPVGAYPSGASRYGAQDMHGNVWEWCWDWYAPGAYQNRAGKEVRDPQGPEEGRERVLRGGSWGDSRSLARCAYRGRDGPDNFLNYLGFRIVCSPSSTSDL